MAAKRSKPETKKSESKSKAAIPVVKAKKPNLPIVSARAARAMRLGVYELHKGGLHSETEVQNLSNEAYHRMEAERE